MAEIFLGKFKLTKSENFDEFLKELGVGMIKRKLAGTTSPEIEITKNGDTYTMVTKSAIKTSSITFKIGEEFDEERQDDAKVTSLIKQEGNKWTHTQTPKDSDKVVTIVRDFSDKGMITVATVGSVSSTREYNRL